MKLDLNKQLPRGPIPHIVVHTIENGRGYARDAKVIAWVTPSALDYKDKFEFRDQDNIVRYYRKAKVEIHQLDDDTLHVFIFKGDNYKTNVYPRS